VTKIERALISVTDKTGIVDFARELSNLGIELISTGGTAKALRSAGLRVRDVSDVTGFPEMLDGRVKTMHPKITGGILAMRGKADHMAALASHQISTIDMVVVNLYAFEKVAANPDADISELIENIDIGGPTMIRSAAKNYQDVAIVVSPSDYQGLAVELRSSGGALSAQTNWLLAQKAFRGYRRLRPCDQRQARPNRQREPSAPRSTYAPANSRTSDTARIRTRRPLCTALPVLGSRARRNSKARNSPTTTWWIWTPPGTWSTSSAAGGGHHQAHQPLRLR
jgi:AICAR transformylase/IMP cyclohydrolase PurH (only IMP cyclohydrolase domain in Aful)